MPAQLRFLGTGDAKGVPRWWCDCTVCQEAKTTGKNQRSRSSVLLTYTESLTQNTKQVLIDASPELHFQLNTLENKYINSVLISHPHNDHIAGLPDLAMWAMDVQKYVKNSFICPLYSPKDVIEVLNTRYGFLKDKPYFPFIDIETLVQPIAGYNVKAIKVPHGFNGHSYAFLFISEHSGKRWAYMSDCIDLEDLEPWYDLELLILGASFYQEIQPRAGRSVYDILEATELSQTLRAKQTILTHMGHGVDRRKQAPASVRYAYDGLVIDLPM